MTLNALTDTLDAITLEPIQGGGCGPQDSAFASGFTLTNSVIYWDQVGISTDEYNGNTCENLALGMATASPHPAIITYIGNYGDIVVAEGTLLLGGIALVP